VVTDEDDSSTKATTLPGQDSSYPREPLTTYAAAYDQITAGERRWALAVIAGETACTTELGAATEAVRLKGITTLAGERGAFSTICAANLGASLQTAFTMFDSACRTLPSQ
jgi:hypothetical protein